MKKEKNVLIIIQARTGSTRLPNKVLVEIEGEPMLIHIFNRLTHVKNASKIAIATTTNDRDTQIIEIAKKYGIPFYAGSENDIVDRTYQSAKKFNADIIVRIAADRPLVDAKLIDAMLERFLKEGCDYLTNSDPPTYPVGLDVDVLSFEALEKLWENTRGDAFLSEWFKTYMIENPGKFKIVNFENSEDLSHLRWTVDYKEDLEFVRKVFSYFFSKNKKIFYMEDVLELLMQKPKLSEINKKFARDEKYKEALAQRKKINTAIKR